MSFSAHAVEMNGMVDKERRLVVEETVPFHVLGPTSVRVIVLIPEPTDAVDPSEEEWNQAANNNPAFGFLRESGENLYSIKDGRPFHDEG